MSTAAARAGGSAATPAVNQRVVDFKQQVTSAVKCILTIASQRNPIAQLRRRVPNSEGADSGLPTVPSWYWCSFIYGGGACSTIGEDSPLGINSDLYSKNIGSFLTGGVQKLAFLGVSVGQVHSLSCGYFSF